MSSITCIITDDEPFSRKGLQGYVEKTGFLNLKAVCEDAMQLSDVLLVQPVDLLFLDIQMPHISGIELIKALSNPPKVIFTTAYEQYAIQGFELDVIDYLLKPIPYDRFLKAACKARDYFSLREKKNAYAATDYMFVKSNGKLEKVIFDDILFIEGMENYVSIQLEGKRIVVHSTIKNMLEKLPVSDFIQTHKSYIVASRKIESVEGNILHIQKHQVPVSRYMREAVLEKIMR